MQTPTVGGLFVRWILGPDGRGSCNARRPRDGLRRYQSISLGFPRPLGFSRPLLEVDLRFEGNSFTNLLEKCATWFFPPLVGGHFLTRGGKNLGISIDLKKKCF